MLRMPLYFEFTYVAPSTPSETGTIVELQWTDFLSFNKLVTIGMLHRFEKAGTLKETGRYVIQMTRKGLRYTGTLIRKNV